ncbi:MAG: hypothetical protein H6574_02665 [Lewinellaceae bacterium]|nr:hypothetical protein [Saprospiraceae bacterium]MCB9329962.1 hypothetical protein [Lewinellaceae bacterium]
MKHLLKLAALILLGHYSLPAQTTLATQSFFEKLSPAENASLTLTTDFTALKKDKKATEYQDGLLRGADGNTYRIGVRPRGKYRRRISEIPPLKLKIKKKILAEEGLVDSLNEIKLVLPTTMDEQGNELVIREYLVYRMYELVSPFAVRARLVNLTMINTNPTSKNAQTLMVKAILLEDEEETEVRLGGKMIEDHFGMTMDSLHREQAALIAVFQFMIGNTDWNVSEHRNLRFLRLPAGDLVPIPFDFDFCGFVNAPYATPMAGSGLRNVQERLLMADALPAEAVKVAARKIEQQKDAILRLCHSGLLPEKDSRSAENYLDSYFKEANLSEAGE